jgi:hypothetical protein
VLNFKEIEGRTKDTAKLGAIDIEISKRRCQIIGIRLAILANPSRFDSLLKLLMTVCKLAVLNFGKLCKHRSANRDFHKLPKLASEFSTHGGLAFSYAKQVRQLYGLCRSL